LLISLEKNKHYKLAHSSPDSSHRKTQLLRVLHKVFQQTKMVFGERDNHCLLIITIIIIIIRRKFITHT